MGAGNFFSGLLSGYAGTVANQEERAYKQHIAARTFDVQTAIKAMDDAVKTGDQTAIQAASANLNRAMQGLETPFDYHRGKGKKGGKGQQGVMNPIAQAAIAGIQRSAQQPSQPMDEKIPAGPQAGQSAQSVGLPAMPAPPQAAVPKPAPAAQTPPIPAPPASLESLYSLPAFRQENQAAVAGTSNAIIANKFAEGLINWQKSQGIHVTPEDEAQIQERVAGIGAKATAMKPTLMTPKGAVTAAQAASTSPNAVLPDGRPLGAVDPKQPVNLWQFPDGRLVAFPATTTPASAGTISGQEAKAVEELVGTPNPETNKPYTRVEAIAKVRAAMTANTLGGKPIPTKTILVKGVPHLMGWDAKTQKYDVDMGLAPQSTGYPRIQPINDPKGNIVGAYVMRAQPSGGTSVTQVSFPHAIPPKPTAALLTQSQRAEVVQPQVNATIALVRQTSDKLGWAAGRWNDAVAKFGANNPDIAALQMKLELFATALMLAHGLRGENYEKKLVAYLNAAQSPDNLVARIQSADDYLIDYAASTGHGATTTATPAPPAKKGTTPKAGSPIKTADEYLKSIGVQ